MKILHVFDHSVPVQDGYSYRSLAILREQRRNGWDTIHLTGPKQEHGNVESEIEGYYFHRTQASDSLLSKAPAIGRLSVISDLRPRISALVDEHSPDIIHAHSPCLNGIAAYLATRKKHIPLVHEIRAFWEDAAVDQGKSREGDLRYRLTRRLEDYLIARADAVVTICHGLRDDLISRGVSPAKISIAANSVDPNDYEYLGKRDQALSEHYQLEDSQVIGFLGSFYAYEGLDLLLDAVASVRSTLPKLKILLVGGGEMDDELQRQARKLNIDDIVIFAGRVPKAEVDRYYSLLDILCLPRKSMRLTETVTPLKPLEAMAKGVVCIASDVGGHRELITNDSTGYLFKKDSVADLAAQISAVFSQPSEALDKVRANGRNYVETERIWSNTVNVYAELYSALLRKN